MTPQLKHFVRACLCALWVPIMTHESNAGVLSGEEALLSITAREERPLPAPQWLSDSRRVVIDAGAATPDLQLFDIATGRKTAFANGSWPTPAPRRPQVALLNGEEQIEVRDADTGRAVRTVPIDSGYELATNWGEGPAFSWSSDERRLLYALAPQPGEEGRKPHRAIALELASGRTTVLFEQSEPILSAQWLGHDALVEVSSPLWTDGEIGIVRDGRLTPLVQGQGQQFLMPQAGPDGRIAFLQDTLLQTVVGSKNLAVFDPRTREVRTLTSDIFVSWVPPRWAGPNQVFALCKRGPFASTFCAEGAASARIETDPLEDISQWSISPDGKSLAWRSVRHDGSQRLWMSAADGSGRRLLEAHPEPLVGSFKLGEAKVFRWKSHDGLELAGLLILPSQRPAGALPLIVDVHGGPMGGTAMAGEILNSTPLEWHYWAGRGHAVFVADYRSSLLYGHKPYLKLRERGDLYADDMQDVLTGVDAVIAAEGIDSRRVAIIGHSAGSALTNYIITRTRRFAVAVTKEGSADWRKAYADNDDAGRRYQHWRFGGSPDQVPQRYEISSPIVQARNVRTPVYIMAASCCAGDDLEKFAREIAAGGGVASYRMFDDAHVFMKPENQRAALFEAIEWIERHLSR